MRTSILYTCIFFMVIYGCSADEQRKVIRFEPLTARQFNFSADTSFIEPQGKAWEERKKMHDSCMGETFAANAEFIRTADTIRLGTIVDMKTMKVVKELGTRSTIPTGPLSSAFTFMTKPCYEKWKIDVPIDVFFKRKIELAIPGATESINKELNLAISNAVSTEMETGSWVNIELTDGFGKILDTTTNPDLLDYNVYLLHSGNMGLKKNPGSTLTENWKGEQRVGPGTRHGVTPSAPEARQVQADVELLPRQVEKQPGAVAVRARLQ